MKERKPLFPEYIWMFFVGLLLAIIVCMRLLPGHAETLDDSYFIYINPSDTNYYKCHGSFGGNAYSPEDSTFDAYYMKPYNSNTWSPVNGMTFSNSSVVKDFIVSGEFYVPDSWNSRSHNSVYVPDNWSINTIAIPYPSNYWNYDYHLIYMSGSNMICALSTKPIYVKNKDDSTIYQSYVPLPQTDQFIYMLQWNGSNWSDLGTATFNDTSISDLHGIDTLYAGYINFGNWVYNTVLGIDIYTDNYAIIESEGSLPIFDILASEFEGSSDIEVDPTPTPEASEPCFTYCVKCDTSYYLVDIYGEVGYDLQANADDIFNQIASEYSSTDRTLLRSCFVIKNDRFNGTAANWQYTGPYIIFYGQFYSFSKAVSYNMGSSYISDFDYVRSTFTGIEVPESTSYEAGYLGYKLQTLTEGGYCLGLWTRGAMTYASSPSVVEYCDFDYVTTSFSYNYYPITLDPFMLTINASYPKTMHNYYLSLVARLGLSTDTPVEGDATPTPSPSPTPTPAPYVNIQWPTGTPTPTPLGIINVNIPTLPIGDLPGVLTENYLDDTVRTINTNAQFGLLSKALSFFPDELMYIVWLFIFILLILAVIKLIIHFGG